MMPERTAVPQLDPLVVERNSPSSLAANTVVVMVGWTSTRDTLRRVPGKGSWVHVAPPSAERNTPQP